MTNDPYDRFAPMYDRHWAELFCDKALFALETLLLPEVPVGGRLLDLCCGAGHAAAALLRRGYRVTGVDRSGALLGRARRRAPEALWVRADARTVALAPIHDGASCLFDSVNHLLSVEDLEAAFRSVRRALHPGAPFVFDVNTDQGFRERWVDAYEMETPEGTCRLRGAYDPESRLGRYRVELLGPGSIDRFDLTERGYTDGEIRHALEEAGFGGIDTADAVTDLDLEDEPGRVFYVACAAEPPERATSPGPREAHHPVP